MNDSRTALPLVSLAVLLASSTWFSGTAAVPALGAAWGLSEAQAAWLTMSTQLGFIAGTFLYALANVADVFNARRVFFASAVAGAAFNAGFAWLSDGLGSALALRLLTGVTLAGVYPVGMRIIASHYRTGLGWRLGVMVGALTLGTATPYLLRALGADLDWRDPVALSSALAVAGGLLMVMFVADGPHLRSRVPFDARVMFSVFRARRFRYTALGYFGHMWELYAFWSLVSAYLAASFGDTPAWADRVPLLAFLAVGAGALGCAAGGWISRTAGERRVAITSLAVSGTACLLAPFAFDAPPVVVVAFAIVWGVFVVSDSPQFSALAARYCPPDYTGTALTVQNGVGFAVTLASIQLLPILAGDLGWRWVFWALAPGPLFGGYYMWRLGRLPSEGEV